MQTANCMVAIGGDVGNTVPKYGVTPSEVAVLRVIHGNEAVTDIDVNGSVSRTNRAERDRLSSHYGKPEPDGSFKARVVDGLFPGAAARLFETFDELEIDEMFFKEASRPKAAPEPEVQTEVPLKKMKKPELLKLAESRGIDVSEDDTVKELIAAIEAAPDPVQDDDDGGVGDMPDANLFK